VDPDLTASLHWICLKEAHEFRAPLRHFSGTRTCPLCEARALAAWCCTSWGGASGGSASLHGPRHVQWMPHQCRYVALITDGSLCSRVCPKFVSNRSIGIRHRCTESVPTEPSVDPPRRLPESLPLELPNSMSIMMQIGWRCGQGHDYSTYERFWCLNDRGDGAQLIVQGTHKTHKAFDKRVCVQCLRGGQQELLHKARAEMQLESVCAAMRARSTEGVQSLGSAEAECGRVLSLPPNADPADVLGLPPRFGTEAARRRFRCLAKMLHPDRCALPRASGAMQLVSEAMQAIERQWAGVGPARSASSSF